MTFSLTITEIIVLMLAAISLGFTVHFFISSRKTFNAGPIEKEKLSRKLEEWKLKYFNDTELRDKEISSLRKQLEELDDNNNINSIEADEMRKLNKKLQAEMETIKKSGVTISHGKTSYINQLKEAQSDLREHNDKISQLLSQIDLVKEAEEKHQEVLLVNEQLSIQVAELRFSLEQKEREVINARQKQQLTNEMT